MMRLSHNRKGRQRRRTGAGAPAERKAIMAFPKAFIDTNDLTGEQILAIEYLAIAMKKPSRTSPSL